MAEQQPDFPTSTRLSRALKDDLKRFAKLQGCSVSWLINHILTEWVKYKKRSTKKWQSEAP